MPEEKRKISPALLIIPAALGLAAVGAIALAAAGKAAPPPGEYICPYCGAPFATYEKLSAHIQAQHPGAYACPYCEATFNTYEELSAHVTSVHPGERIPIDIIWT